MTETPYGQFVDCRRVLAHLPAQAAGVERDDKGQRDSYAESGMFDSPLEGDQRGRAADEGAMVAGQATVPQHQRREQRPAAHRRKYFAR